MNREILFRGFYPDKNGKQIITVNGKQMRGEWVYGSYIHVEKLVVIGCKHFIMEYSKDGTTHEVIPETVGRYTGLDDSNGKRIFEGGILKDIITGELFQVIFEGYSFLRLSKKHFFLGFDLSCEDYEVVGTIFDNPELLEGEVNEHI